MTTRTSRDEWSLRVQRWERSGLSASAFAAREAVRAKSLVWWRWKLCRGEERGSEGESAASAFVRLEAPASTSGDVIEIALDNGRVVRVPPVFDDSVLVRVLAVAESR
jgi:hypothetical protein